MDKNALRKKYKTLRKALTPEKVESQSMAIANQLLRLPIWNKTNYHVFLSIEEHKEVNTEYVLHILSGKDKNSILSKSDFSNNTLSHFLLTDGTKIQKNHWNIPEPVDGVPFPVEAIEVVFVPLLAFDTFGNRVGYGKGFYDRFLNKCKPGVLKIGLSFFEAEDQPIAVLPTDIRLDYCVTPEKVYRF